MVNVRGRKVLPGARKIIARKILRDIWLYKARTALIIAAITVGVTAVGITATAETVLRHDLFASYAASTPPDAILTLPPFKPRLVKTLRRLPEVQAVEARRVVVADLEIAPDRWMALELHAIPDFEALSINRLVPEPGTPLTPPEGSMLLERSLLSLPEAAIGPIVRVRTADGRLHEIAIAGLVNDLGPYPTDMNMLAIGYLTSATLTKLLPGQTSDNNRMYVITTARSETKTWPRYNEVQQAVARIAETTASYGYPVLRIYLPEPGKPILADNINTILVMLGVLGVLSLLLSALLIVNVTLGLIGQQIPQIGILKSLGGRTSQITHLYLHMVLILGLVAALISLPLGIWGAYALINIAAADLDFDVISFGLPLRSLLLQGASALLVPMLVALIPIIGGSRITVRQAIRRTGLAAGNTLVNRLLARLLARIQGLPVPYVVGMLLTIALRNVFRKWARMLLTLTALALGGAIFMAMLGIRQSLSDTIATIQRVKNYDVEIHFPQLYPMTCLEREAHRVPGVVAVESRGGAQAYCVCDDAHVSASFPLIAAPPETTMTLPFVVEGRWLQPGEARAIFINTDIIDLIGKTNVGDEIVLDINGDERAWHLVGIAGRTFSPHAFITRKDFERLVGGIGYANQLVIQTEQHTPAFQALVENRLRAHFDRAAMPISYAWVSGPSQQALARQLDTVVVVTLLMASLAAVVGGLGLASTLGLNVLERTREIGILRSLGAQSKVIRRMVILEGVATSLLSFALAVPLSVPLSLVLGRAVGQALLRYPLDYAFSWVAMLLWLGIVVVIAILASLLPATRAANLTIHKTMAYVG